MVNLAARVEKLTMGALWTRLAALEDRVKNVASSQAMLAHGSVEGGKSLTVRGLLSVLGSVSMKSVDGTELFRMGSMTYGRGVTMARDNGSIAFQLLKPFAVSTLQSWGFYDQAGQIVVAESSIGPGLFRPHLDLPFQPVAAASGSAVSCGPYGFERSMASTSWTTLFVYDGKAQNGLLDLKTAAMCSDGTTAGQIQIIDTVSGVPLSGYLLPSWLGVIPAGTTSMTVVDPAPDAVILPVYGPGQAVGDQMRLGIQVRRTAGAGTITLAVPQAIGG